MWTDAQTKSSAGQIVICSSLMMAFGKRGQRMQILLDEENATRVLQDLVRLAPHAIYGFDKRLDKLWQSQKGKAGKDRSGFLAKAKAIQGLPGAEAVRTATTLQG